jgi:hypothetical protein
MIAVRSRLFVAGLRVPSTKKLLVAFDPMRPDAMSSDFLAPLHRDGHCILLGLKSREERSIGLVVFLGRAVTENDLFAKLVDSGARMIDVNQTLAMLRSYLIDVQALKIGNVVRVRCPKEKDNFEFEFEVVAKTPSSMKG